MRRANRAELVIIIYIFPSPRRVPLSKVKILKFPEFPQLDGRKETTPGVTVQVNELKTKLFGLLSYIVDNGITIRGRGFVGKSNFFFF